MLQWWGRGAGAEVVAPATRFTGVHGKLLEAVLAVTALEENRDQGRPGLSEAPDQCNRSPNSAASGHRRAGGLPAMGAYLSSPSRDKVRQRVLQVPAPSHRERGGPAPCRPSLCGAGGCGPAIAHPADCYTLPPPLLLGTAHLRRSLPLRPPPPARRNRARARTMRTSLACRRCRAGGRTWCAEFRRAGCGPPHNSANGGYQQGGPTSLQPLGFAGCCLSSHLQLALAGRAAAGGCARRHSGSARRQLQGRAVCCARRARRGGGGEICSQPPGALACGAATVQQRLGSHTQMC